MNTTTRTRTSIIAALAATMLALTGCAGAPADTTADTTGPPVDATVVTVIATEYMFELSESTFTPGTYTFELTNEGGMPHDLVIDGPGVDRASTSVIPSGETTSVTVELEAGTYDLWCSVGSHRSRGMEVTIEVA